MKKRFLITFILLSLNHIMANVNSNNMPTPGPVAHYQAKFIELSGQASSKLNSWDDSTNQTYGPELVTNGDFSDGFTGWNQEAGMQWSIDTVDGDSVARDTVAGPSGGLVQSNVIELNKKYLVTFRASDIQNGSPVMLYGASNHRIGDVTEGFNSYIIESALGSGAIRFSGEQARYWVTDVSVKEVLTGTNDLTQSTSGNQPTLVEQNVMTQFTSANQPTFVEGFRGTGAELATNGDFSAGATGWFLTGGSVSAGELIINVVSSSFSYAAQGKAFTEGTKYIVTVRVKGSNSNAGFRVTDNQSGIGGLKGAQNRTQLTTDYQDFEFVFTANSNSVVIAIERDTSWGTDFEVIVDSVSLKEAVKEIAKDKVSFSTNDFMEGLPPQNEPASFGSELFTNPPDTVNGFTDNGDGSYTVSVATGSQDQLIVANVTEDLKSYQCTITIDSISAGQINFAVGGDGSPVYTSAGTYTSIVTRNGGGDNLNVYGSTDFVGTVSNISVKEITGYQDFTYVFKGLDYDLTQNYCRILTTSNSNSNGSFYFQQNSGGQWVVRADDATYFVLTTSIENYDTIVLKKEASILSLSGDGVLIGVFGGDVSKKSFSFPKIGNKGVQSLNGSLQSLEVYDVAVSDVNNITEVPVYTLKSDLVDIPSGYGPMYKWYAKEHNPNDNKIKLDSNDFMKGLPPQSGDFTYVFKGLTTGTNGGRVFLSSSTPSNFRIDGFDNLLKFRGDDSNSLTFSGTSLESLTGVLILKKQGYDYSAYINGVQFGTTVTNTANFKLERIGHPSVAFNGSLQELCVYDRALTEEEIEIVSDPNYEFNSDSLPNESDNYPWQDDSNNIFIGYQAGQNETDSNKLYIENSDSSSPLIYGEFDKDLVRINGQFNVSDNAQIDGQLIVSSKAQIDGELRVAGGIRTNEVNVQLQSAWPDYVFADDYQLPTIMEMSKHIKEHKHLPGVPSAADIAKDGLDMAKIMTAQMEKIEELSLYIIELEKKNQELKADLSHSIELNNKKIQKILETLKNNKN